MTAGLYPTHPDDGDANAPTYLRDLGERDGADGRTGDATGLAAEPRLARPVRMRAMPAQRVDQRDGVGAVRLGGGGDVRRRRAVRA